QGRENAREFLKANPDIAGEIEQQVRGNAVKIVDSLLLGAAEPEDD
ncbi:MAG: DNA recombination/repair protein RecA, partial [Pseudomonadota bacterium]